MAATTALPQQQQQIEQSVGDHIMMATSNHSTSTLSSSCGNDDLIADAAATTIRVRVKAWKRVVRRQANNLSAEYVECNLSDHFLLSADQMKKQWYKETMGCIRELIVQGGSYLHIQDTLDEHVKRAQKTIDTLKLEKLQDDLSGTWESLGGEWLELEEMRNAVLAVRLE